MKKIRMIALSSLAIFCSSLNSKALWAQSRNDIIAQSGQAAPDGNGTYSGLGIPVLNNSGQAAFRGFLTGTSGGLGDNEGIFRGSGDSITQIARKGLTGPGAAGIFSSFGLPVLNDSGQAAFNANLMFGVEFSGIFRGSGGSITQIVKNGAFAPEGNGRFLQFGGPSLNDSGQMAFLANLIDSSDYGNTGIFLGSGGSITQIARAEQSAPDANGTFAGFNVAPVLNDPGQVAFRATLIGTSGGSNDDQGIFRGNGGSITQVAREGQSAPDANGTFSVFGDPLLNNSGQAAFHATLTGTSGGVFDNEGIFTGDGLIFYRSFGRETH